jgi:hypothetical protein
LHQYQNNSLATDVENFKNIKRRKAGNAKSRNGNEKRVNPAYFRIAEGRQQKQQSPGKNSQGKGNYGQDKGPGRTVCKSHQENFTSLWAALQSGFYQIVSEYPFTQRVKDLT